MTTGMTTGVTTGVTTAVTTAVIAAVIAGRDIVGTTREQRCEWRRWAGGPLTVSVCLAIAATLIHAVPGATEALQWQRGALTVAPWRALSGHLTHFGVEHLAYDVLALVLLGAAARPAGTRRVVAALLGAGVAIPLALDLFRPDLDVYRGLSGLDAALFAVVLADRTRRAAGRGESLRVLGLAAVAAAGVGKLIYELSAGQAVFVDAAAGGFLPVPLAHAVGAVMGLIASTWNNDETAPTRSCRSDPWCVPSPIRPTPGSVSTSSCSASRRRPSSSSTRKTPSTSSPRTTARMSTSATA